MAHREKAKNHKRNPLREEKNCINGKIEEREFVMALLTNPVLVSVIVLCVLCLLKLNVLMSLIIAAMVGAMLGGISIPDAMGILCDGFSGNANTALSYVLLGTFATAIASTGLADMLSKKLSKIMGGKGKLMLVILAAVACLSQNLVPVHIAFIPILIPPPAVSDE